MLTNRRFAFSVAVLVALHSALYGVAQDANSFQPELPVATPSDGAPFDSPNTDAALPQPALDFGQAPLSSGTSAIQPNRSSPAQIPSADVGKKPETVPIQYSIRRPVKNEFRNPDGKVTQVMSYTVETQSASIEVTADLEKLDLPLEGKRAAVLAVTAARHQKLLDQLKAAKTPEEKEAARVALKENYTQHYAIETWWREQKLSELEKRLEELRAQVTQRQESEEKYVTAAMTIAELWADGIGITPPRPNHQPLGVPTSLPGPVNSLSIPHSTATPTYGPSPAPPAVPQFYPSQQVPRYEG